MRVYTANNPNGVSVAQTKTHKPSASRMTRRDKKGKRLMAEKPKTPKTPKSATKTETKPKTPKETKPRHTHVFEGTDPKPIIRTKMLKTGALRVTFEHSSMRCVGGDGCTETRKMGHSDAQKAQIAAKSAAAKSSKS